MRYKEITVDYKTPLEEQLKELGIKNYLNLKDIKNLHEPSPDGKIYDVEDGTDMLGVSPDDSVKQFGKENRRALTIHEALAVYRYDKGILKRHNIDISGSRYGARYVPFLCLDGDEQPGLGSNLSGHADPRWGSLSCGSKKLDVEVCSLDKQTQTIQEVIDSRVKKHKSHTLEECPHCVAIICELVEVEKLTRKL